MSDHKPVDPAKQKRQERLEARLRDNLRRRKDAARNTAEPGSAAPAILDDDEADGTDGGDGGGD